jgi:hypothetical protein
MPRGGRLLLVATAVVAATLLVAVPLRRAPVASELAEVELTAANGETLELAGTAFGKKQQAMRQMAAAPRRSAPRSASRLAAVPTAARPVREEKKVISGKAIFARMVRVLGKVAKENRSKAARPAPKPPADLPMSPKFATKALKQALLQSLAAETVNDEREIDVNGTHSQQYSTCRLYSKCTVALTYENFKFVADDPPAQTVYVYRGRETKTKTDDLVTFILAGGFGIPDIKYIESSSDADMRKALWDEATHFSKAPIYYI